MPPAVRTRFWTYEFPSLLWLLTIFLSEKTGRRFERPTFRPDPFRSPQIHNLAGRKHLWSSQAVGTETDVKASGTTTPSRNSRHRLLNSTNEKRLTTRDFMKHENVDSRRMNLHQRIALVLRKEPWLVRVFAERLRSKLAMERSAAGCSDNEREWYIILTLWSPLQMIRLLEDSVNAPTGFARILHLSLCCRISA
jgi:hypothetical protein